MTDSAMPPPPKPSNKRSHVDDEARPSDTSSAKKLQKQHEKGRAEDDEAASWEQARDAYMSRFEQEPTPCFDTTEPDVKIEPGTETHANGAGHPGDHAHHHVPYLETIPPAAPRPFVADIFNSDKVCRGTFQGAFEHINSEYDPRSVESVAMSELLGFIAAKQAAINTGHRSVVEQVVRNSLAERFAGFSSFFQQLWDEAVNATSDQLLALDFPTLHDAREGRLDLGRAALIVPASYLPPTPAQSSPYDNASNQLPSGPSPAAYATPSRVDGTNPVTTVPRTQTKPASSDDSHHLNDDSSDGSDNDDSVPSKKAIAPLPKSAKAPAKEAKSKPALPDKSHESSDDSSDDSEDDDDGPVPPKEAVAPPPTAPKASAKKPSPKSKSKSKSRPDQQLSSSAAVGKVETEESQRFANPHDLYLHVVRWCVEAAVQVKPTDDAAKSIWTSLTDEQMGEWRSLCQSINKGKANFEDGHSIFDSQRLLPRLDPRVKTKAQELATIFPGFQCAMASHKPTQPYFVPHVPQPLGAKDDHSLLIILRTPCTAVTHPSQETMRAACASAFTKDYLTSVTKQDDNTWIVAFKKKWPVYRACESHAQITIAGKRVEVEFHHRSPPRAFLSEITGVQIDRSAINDSVSSAFRGSKCKPALFLQEKNGQRQLLLKFNAHIVEPPGVQRWYIPLLLDGAARGKPASYHMAVFRPRSKNDKCLLCDGIHGGGTSDCRMADALMFQV